MLVGFSFFQLSLLALLVFFAGIVDALAGGGGIITLPAYLAVGLDPNLILGTNKLSSSIGTVASAVKYQRHVKFSLLHFLPVILASLIGSFLGARLTALLDPRWLRPLLILLLPVIAFFVYSKHDHDAPDQHHTIPQDERIWRYILVAFPLGCYDGFFGPGTGTFLAVALTRFCRHDLLTSTARAKILNLVSNLSALAAFLIAGKVQIALGLGLGLASIAGHYTGSHLGIKKGGAAIRPAILAVCSGLFLKLLIDFLRGA